MKKKIIFFVLLFAVMTGCYLLIMNRAFYDDEYAQIDQMKVFLKGEFRLKKGISTLPGYSLFLTLFAGTFDRQNRAFLRGVNLAAGLASIYIFYLLAKKIDRENALFKTVQYAFLPVLFPFRFLLYTESLSNLMLFAGFYAGFSQKYKLAAILTLLAVTVRQTNIVWMIFLFIILYQRKFLWVINWKNVKSFFKSNFIFIIGIILFALFVYINGGVAVKDAATPSFQLHTGNVYFFLFLFLFLFFPVNLAAFGEIFRRILRHKLIILPLILFFMTAVFTYKNSHGMNTDPRHLRNMALIFFDTNLVGRIIYVAGVILGLLAFLSAKFLKPRHYLLLPFSFLSLLPLWLVEPRYTIVAFSLFILFRRSENNRLEWLQSGIFVALSIIFYWIILKNIYYL